MSSNTLPGWQVFDFFEAALFFVSTWRSALPLSALSALISSPPGWQSGHLLWAAPCRLQFCTFVSLAWYKLLLGILTHLRLHVKLNLRLHGKGSLDRMAGCGLALALIVLHKSYWTSVIFWFWKNFTTDKIELIRAGFRFWAPHHPAPQPSQDTSRRNPGIKSETALFGPAAPSCARFLLIVKIQEEEISFRTFLLVNWYICNYFSVFHACKWIYIM